MKQFPFFANDELRLSKKVLFDFAEFSLLIAKWLSILFVKENIRKKHDSLFLFIKKAHPARFERAAFRLGASPNHVDFCRYSTAFSCF